MIRFLLVLWVILVFDLQSYAQEAQTKLGDPGMAEKYVAWGQRAIAEGRWSQALAGLERGADFSTISSDLSYLLALTRFHENRPCGAALEALGYALETNRWNWYTPLACRLLEAEILIRLCRFSEALGILSLLPQNNKTLCLRLQALKGLDHREAFEKLMAETLEAYPRDPRPVRIFFEYAGNRLPLDRSRELLSLVLKRLPFLIEGDPELAYLAAPFISDIEEARRLLGAYWAIHTPVFPSIPAALNLGIIDGKQAVDELFRDSPPVTEKRLDKDVLLSVWSLLRDNTERDYFRKHLAGFSGFIIEDADRDGFAESQVQYKQGELAAYYYDMDQDGLPELTIFFEAGVPATAEFVLAPDFAEEGKPGPVAYPLTNEERVKGILQWEQYPGVLQAQVEGVVYIPKPLNFFFFPIYFKKLESGGLLYPEGNPFKGSISRRTLVLSSRLIERPSREFPGAIEQIELSQGIPQRACELLGGRLVSETSFHLGRALTQRIDLDLNGYLETVRHFREPGTPGVYRANLGIEGSLDFKGIIDFSESDWDGDGIFEYVEQYRYEDSEYLNYTVFGSWNRGGGGTGEFSNQIRYTKK